MEHLHFYPDHEKIMSFHPHIIFSGILNGSHNWSNGIHRHNFCEIMYITAGSGKVIIEDKEYPIGQGDVVVYNAGVFHEEYCTGDELAIMFFAIDNLKIPGMKDGHIIPEDANPVVCCGSYDDTFRSFLSVMVDELAQKLPHYKAISTQLASIFCYYILRIYKIKTENTVHMKICEQAKDYIGNNYASNINLDTMAKSFHISKYYFIHLFKELTGISPMKYLLYVRLGIAKELLSKTELPIGEIATKVGYENGLIFGRAFKNSENISPTEYRSRTQVKKAVQESAG